MMRSVLGVALIFCVSGCPVNLDDFDERCELNEYVSNEACTPCEDGSENKAGDFRFDGDTQCDYPIEFDLIGNYGSFHAYLDGSVVYNGAAYTILETDHDGHYVFLQKDADNSFVQLDWRQTNDGLCLSFTNEKSSQAELPGADSVLFNDEVDCFGQAASGAWVLFKPDDFGLAGYYSGDDGWYYDYKNEASLSNNRLVISGGSLDPNFSGNVLMYVQNNSNPALHTVIVDMIVGDNDFFRWDYFRLDWDNRNDQHRICLDGNNTIWTAINSNEVGECDHWVDLTPVP